MTFDGGRPLRPGRHNPGNLYEQNTAETDHLADLDIGWGDAAAVSTAACAVNAGVPAAGAAGWWCDGAPGGRALVYDRDDADPVSGWVIAVRSRAHADRIVAAVNGQVSDA